MRAGSDSLFSAAATRLGAAAGSRLGGSSHRLRGSPRLHGRDAGLVEEAVDGLAGHALLGRGAGLVAGLGRVPDQRDDLPRHLLVDPVAGREAVEQDDGQVHLRPLVGGQHRPELEQHVRIAAAALGKLAALDVLLVQAALQLGEPRGDEAGEHGRQQPEAHLGVAEGRKAIHQRRRLLRCGERLAHLDPEILLVADSLLLFGRECHGVCLLHRSVVACSVCLCRRLHIHHSW
jgi:hypothetical protein